MQKVRRGLIYEVITSNTLRIKCLDNVLEQMES